MPAAKSNPNINPRCRHDWIKTTAESRSVAETSASILRIRKSVISVCTKFVLLWPNTMKRVKTGQNLIRNTQNICSLIFQGFPIVPANHRIFCFYPD
jgi:hypothetical protein